MIRTACDAGERMLRVLCRVMSVVAKFSVWFNLVIYISITWKIAWEALCGHGKHISEHVAAFYSLQTTTMTVTSANTTLANCGLKLGNRALA